LGGGLVRREGLGLGWLRFVYDVWDDGGSLYFSELLVLYICMAGIWIDLVCFLGPAQSCEGSLGLSVTEPGCSPPPIILSPH
jgi:hypothetical protein